MEVSALFPSKVRSENLTNRQENVAGMMIDESRGWIENIIMMMMVELRKKVMVLRGIINFPPYDEASPLNELVMETVRDLHELYPTVLPLRPILDIKEVSLYQALVHLYNALKSIGDSWANNHKWTAESGCHVEESLENITLEQLGGKVLAKLNYIIKLAREVFDIVDEDKRNDEKQTDHSNIREILGASYSDNKIIYSSPTCFTLAPQELCFSMIYILQFLLPFGLQAPGNIANNEMLKDSESINTRSPSLQSSPPQTVSVAPISSKLNSNMMPGAMVPLLPPSQSFNVPLSVTTTPPPPPPAAMPMTNRAAPPPPPPLGVAKALRPRKSNNKLRRSTHMGNLYRVLKGKLEGSTSLGKNSQGRKSAIGGSTGGKQGMADALAEMTKRSAYFQQIEEDVQKHREVIMEMKGSISSFQTKDMNELIKFQKHVEQHLEKLTDETQVLARFEDFPTKKLEALRIASALYLKLKGIATDMQNWKVAPPLGQLLDRVHSYFNKIKRELDALERTKDEDSKRFQSHNIYFDFHMFVKIKEDMVDVSSSCMELALQERRQANATVDAEIGSKTVYKTTKASAKMLWKAFKLAFWVYTYAGGQDDRADRLTKQLAQEIENDPEHKCNILY